MPASYAHYRFGKLLLPALPADVRQCIQRFRRMYDAGLQGPDFFFYYSPGLNTATYALGHSFHMQSGQEFFTTACASATSEAARAYLYGLLAHYCLDAAVHPFVDRLTEIGEAKHIPLEAEFERFLLEKDGEKSPHTFNRGKFIRLTRGECMTVAEFYPGVTGGKIRHSFCLMALCIRLLAHPNRKLQEQVLNRTCPQYLEHRLPTESSDALAPYVSELYELFRQAMQNYPALLEELTAHLQTGKDFSEAFSPCFG